MSKTTIALIVAAILLAILVAFELGERAGRVKSETAQIREHLLAVDSQIDALQKHDAEIDKRLDGWERRWGKGAGAEAPK